ncbi:MAG: hypothetical protein ACHQE5_14430 [Actinomycetes bacterium]
MTVPVQTPRGRPSVAVAGLAAVVVLLVLAAVVSAWGLSRFGEWRTALPYRSAAGATLDQLGVPDVPGATPGGPSENWTVCTSHACAVAVRSIALPRHRTLAQVRDITTGWLDNHLSVLGRTYGFVAIPISWDPICQYRITEGPGGFGCISRLELPGTSPSRIVYVSVRFADPKSVHTTDLGANTFEPDPDDRVSSLSVAVMAYDPLAKD